VQKRKCEIEENWIARKKNNEQNEEIEMPEYITKEGMNFLQKKMSDLVKIRSEVIQQVVAAREMGDLSENAEYHAAREKQGQVENEYNRIKSRIGKLQVIDTSKIAKDVIRFGARITLKNNQTKEISKVRLVGADELFSTEDGFMRTSFASPLGRALIGRKSTEIVIVKAPIGDREFTILSIE
jgi:transcription elongation factor GreA